MGHGDLFLGPDVIAAQSRAGIGGVGRPIWSKN